MSKILYQVTDPGHTFDSYNVFADQHIPSKLRRLWAQGEVPAKSHRFYMLNSAYHSAGSHLILNVLQDIQTQKIYIVDSRYVTLGA